MVGLLVSSALRYEWLKAEVRDSVFIDMLNRAHDVIEFLGGEQSLRLFAMPRADASMMVRLVPNPPSRGSWVSAASSTLAVCKVDAFFASSYPARVGAKRL
jgi:hypothetical protein